MVLAVLSNLGARDCTPALSSKWGNVNYGGGGTLEYRDESAGNMLKVLVEQCLPPIRDLYKEVVDNPARRMALPPLPKASPNQNYGSRPSHDRYEGHTG
jgi:hypothetical protein